LPLSSKIGEAGDSSLVRVEFGRGVGRYYFQSWTRTSNRWLVVSPSDLRKRILNHIGTSTPRSSANKEFIRNLGGNYIVVNHKDGTVRGTAPSTWGFEGSQRVNFQPQMLYEGETDNGNVYQIDGWFSFSTLKYNVAFLQGGPYARFGELMRKAGLMNVRGQIGFVNQESSYYTMLIPTDSVLNILDTLPDAKLTKTLKYHFIEGDLVFTDGKKPAGLYNTTSINEEASDPYITRYHKLHLRPKADVIEILDKNGDVYLEIPEEEGVTNRFVVTETGEGVSESRWNFMTTGVIHRIDKPLMIDSLEAK
jgi:uncharacterized surface protein with fasciclin (FAS1) repeats